MILALLMSDTTCHAKQTFDTGRQIRSTLRCKLVESIGHGSKHKAAGWAAYTIGAVIHEILPVGMLQCNCSIFGDEQSREAIVVDPGDDISTIGEALGRHGLTVKAIVITHAHIDHIGGAAKLK